MRAFSANLLLCVYVCVCVCVCVRVCIGPSSQDESATFQEVPCCQGEPVITTGMYCGLLLYCLDVHGGIVNVEVVMQRLRSAAKCTFSSSAVLKVCCIDWIRCVVVKWI